MVVSSSTFGLQIIGIVFGLSMLYLSYRDYRRREIYFKDFMVWLTIWVGFLFAVSFPGTLEIVSESLGIVRVLDLLIIFSIMLLFSLVFMVYDTVRKSERKIDKVVEAVALKDAEKKK